MRGRRERPVGTVCEAGRAQSDIRWPRPASWYGGALRRCRPRYGPWGRCWPRYGPWGRCWPRYGPWGRCWPRYGPWGRCWPRYGPWGRCWPRYGPWGRCRTRHGPWGRCRARRRPWGRCRLFWRLLCLHNCDERQRSRSRQRDQGNYTRAPYAPAFELFLVSHDFMPVHNYPRFHVQTRPIIKRSGTDGRLGSLDVI